MKKQFLSICAVTTLLLGVTDNSYAQWLTSGSDMYVPGSTNIGIGTSNISDRLTVQGDMGFHLNLNSSTFRKVNGRSPNSGFALYGNSDFSNGAGIILNGDNNSSNGGQIGLVSGDGASTNIALNLMQYNSGAYNGLFTIYKDAQVTIGNATVLTTNDYKLYVETGIQTDKILIGDINTNTPGGYRLYVEEGILTEKIKVALTSDPTNWSDFVFDADYDLRSLSEVENYIQENKHLPEIPSTEEVHQNGLDLAQMDAKLLQKVEELTLYLIQQQKEIDVLKSKLNK